MSNTNTYGGDTSGDVNHVEFTAKKYGKDSYLVMLDNLEPGEYGVTVRNPNNRDEKNSLQLATFGID